MMRHPFGRAHTALSCSSPFVDGADSPSTCALSGRDAGPLGRPDDGAIVIAALSQAQEICRDLTHLLPGENTEFGHPVARLYVLPVKNKADQIFAGDRNS